MPKVKISEFDIDPANNTDINNINIAEGCAPSGINNAIRQLMSDLKEFQTGAGGDPFNGAVNGTVGATTPATGAFTTLSASSTATLNTLSSSGATITGGSINGTTVGASTASTGAFTSLSASGAFSANGGATLGDASGDALTINSSAVSIPNGLNFDSNTFVIDATNNRVGVGTASPAFLLDLVGSTGASGAISSITTADNAAAGRDFLRLIRGGTGTVGTLEYSESGALGLTGSSTVIFKTASTERMRIDSSGNVGIGTISPTSRLNVITTSADYFSPQVIVGDSSSLSTGKQLWIGYNTTATKGYIQSIHNNVGYTDLLLNPSGGNVGIGTSSPSFKLDVSGAAGNGIRYTGNSVSSVFGESGSGAFIGTTTNHFAAFATNATERMRIDSSGNVGIGTSSPSYRLHVNGGAGQPAYLQSTSTASVVYFDDTNTTSEPYCGSVGNEFIVGTSSTDRMRITSTGLVGIGTSSPANPLEVNQGSNSSVAGLKVSGPTWTMLDLTTTNTDSNARNWRLAGVLSAFGRFELLSGSTQGGVPNTTVLSVSAASSIALQGASPQTGTGITFPATQSASSNANTLDDYEEGTWTPTVSSGITGVSYARQAGTYTKIGNLVQIQISLETSGGTKTASDFILGGLPFTTSNFNGGVALAYAFGNSGFVNSTSTNYPNMYINGNTSTVSFYNTDGSTFVGTQLNNAVFRLDFSGTYQVL